MKSQPGPSGTQLTAACVPVPVAALTPAAALAAALAGPVRGLSGDGSSLALSALPALPALPALAALFALPALRANDAVDGLGNGPVVRSQPDAHPVAAGPAKVGAWLPRLETVTVDVTLAGAAARARPAGRATRRPTSNSVRRTVRR
jgi:hypothetical protein